MLKPLAQREVFPPVIRYLPSVASTMDTVKEMLASRPRDEICPPSPFGVVAASQTKGRGTGEKQWTSPPGNLYLTLAVPEELVPQHVIPVLPLLMGLVVRNALLRVCTLPRDSPMHSCSNSMCQPPSPDILLKWPNDVVWSSRKLCGMLIEHNASHLLIGIGVNIKTAPDVADGGRETTSVAEILKGIKAGPTSTESGRILCPSTQEVAEAIWRELFDSIAPSADEGKTIERKEIVERFSKAMDWSLTQYKRNQDRTPMKAVRLTEWGQLVARAIGGTEEEVLTTEYLF